MRTAWSCSAGSSSSQCPSSTGSSGGSTTAGWRRAASTSSRRRLRSTTRKRSSSKGASEREGPAKAGSSSNRQGRSPRRFVTCSGVEASRLGPMLYRFGPYELDEEGLTLRRGVDTDGAAEPIALEPKPFAVLLHLLRRHPVLVENQELLDTVWNDVVVTRSSLARAVRALRRAFGEEADGDSVIRTARGRGYGIAVPVAREAGAA